MEAPRAWLLAPVLWACSWRLALGLRAVQDHEGCGPARWTPTWCSSKMGSPDAPYDLAVDGETRIFKRETVFLCSQGKHEVATLQEWGLPADLKGRDGKEPVVLYVGGDGLGERPMMFAKSGYRVVWIEPRNETRLLFNISLCANQDVRHLVELEASLPSAPGAPESCLTCKHAFHMLNNIMVCPKQGRPEDPDNPLTCDFQNGEASGMIQAKTMDQVLTERRVDDVDVVVMHAGGREFRALLGAQDLFSRIKPRFVMAELQNKVPNHFGDIPLPEVDAQPAEFVRKLWAHGYDVYTDRFNGTPLTGDARVSKYRLKKFFFVRKGQ